MKGILLELIRDEYQSLLQLSADFSEESWAQVVSQANPVFFCLNDGATQIQIGEASRERLLDCLKQHLAM